MTVRLATVFVRMAFLFFLAESPFAPLLAGRYPAYVVPIVLVGAPVIAAPLGIVVARALRRKREDELAETYRRLEGYYILAAIASQVGVVMASLGRGTVGTLGVVVSAGGTSAALWLLLKAASVGSARGARRPASMDDGMRGRPE
jgi:hypothetical protein